MHDEIAVAELARTAGSLGWTALIEDSGADVAVLSAEGRALYVSPTLNWWAVASPSQAVGKTLHDLFPAEMADERLELVRRVSATQRVLVLYGIWKGVRTRTVLRPLPPAQPGELPRVLAVCRGYHNVDRELMPANADQAEAKHVDHGRLGVLTPRELEILSMIARGMTTATIAKELFRSRKTIEAHRLSIGAKLGARNRVELARIALEAGLLQGQPGSGRHQTGRRYERAKRASGMDFSED